MPEHDFHPDLATISKSYWKPIETAPKDRDILLWNGDEYCIGWWETAKEFNEPFNDWCKGDAGAGTGYDCGFDRVHNPTHWMPLPPAPTR